MRIDKVEYVGDRIIITGDELPILRTVIVDPIVGKVDLLHNNINFKVIELGKDLIDYFRQEDKIKLEKLKRENEECKQEVIKNMEVKLKRAIEKELELELKRQQLSGD